MVFLLPFTKASLPSMIFGDTESKGVQARMWGENCLRCFSQCKQGKAVKIVLLVPKGKALYSTLMKDVSLNHHIYVWLYKAISS